MQSPVVDALENLPLSFEENIGQVDNQVAFLTRVNGQTVFLTANEAVVTLQTSPAQGIPPSVLRMQLLDANPAPYVSGLDNLPGHANYIIGNESDKWRTEVPRYAKVRYQDVYPGVDMVYRGNERKLEHDFIVRPEIDPGIINLGFEGAESLSIDALGNLVLRVAGGAVTLERPVTYQIVGEIRHQIESKFVLDADNKVRFDIGKYDRHEPLIIDPVLEFSTFFGGTGNDVAWNITVDSSDNIYVIGQTGSINFPVGPFPKPVESGGDLRPYTTEIAAGEVFVSKIDPAGTKLIYTTFLGGSAEDTGWDIAVDSDGNAYITGSTQSKDFPTKNARQGFFRGGPLDAFVAKLDASGSKLIYSTYLGERGNDVARGIAVDSEGSAYVAGYGEGDLFSVKDLRPVSEGTDAFVVKYTKDGSGFVYSTFLGGSGYDRGLGIAVDADGNAHVTGSTQSTDFLAGQPESSGRGRNVTGGFVTKLNPDGSSLIYAYFAGGQWGSGITIGKEGHSYAVGSFSGTGFLRLDANGSLVVSPTSELFGVGHAVAVDGSGDIYRLDGVGFSPTLTKLDGNAFSTVYRMSLTESLATDRSFQPQSIATDSTGAVYVTGFAQNLITVRPMQSESWGGKDAFLAKIVLAVPPNPPLTPIVVPDLYITATPVPTRSPGVTATPADGRPVVLATAAPISTPIPVATNVPTQGPAVSVLPQTSAPIVWAKSMGGAGSDFGSAIAVDSSGNVHTTGAFGDRLNPTADFDPGPDTLNLTSNGRSDVFVSKLDSNGDFLWAKSIGGTDHDSGYGIAVDSGGNVHTTGAFRDTVDFEPGPGTFSLTSSVGDVFVSKLDSNGDFLWAKSMGGTSLDQGNSIAVDSGGNVYTTGFFRGTVDFDPGPGTFNLTGSGAAKFFVSKLDSKGNFLWAKSIGGPLGISGTVRNGIAVDGRGNIHTTGNFTRTADFDPGQGTLNLTSSGDLDIFVSKLSGFLEGGTTTDRSTPDAIVVPAATTVPPATLVAPTPIPARTATPSTTVPPQAGALATPQPEPTPNSSAQGGGCSAPGSEKSGIQAGWILLFLMLPGLIIVGRRSR